MDLMEHLEALREHVEGTRAVAVEPDCERDGRAFENSAFDKHIDALLASGAEAQDTGAVGTASDHTGVEEASGRRGRES